ncbi:MULTISPECIES: tripartite tricarboxylate transporter substrate-binding protein [unclassified Beijerinckia]|uniref:Bug family tripartite tricarboxylate transporter substrate binding protein n=1 Tax=unclassified Beijerinckia TaxID=2638183 RepID=UPI000896F15C|nr:MULTISPECIES: tripartite tricarboxylate transporter substrate-binding protein [unclassified Beijerinckia]MDH7795318.1 tripartite-type tricarboxylate transporter receptor subunit TctC [Beijerinckia sp. GAS462]SEB96582.1 Tripartite-type tricarboxylate transporter, receptor component TctC [Beijerinckia sp. 28-YEA-48]
MFQRRQFIASSLSLLAASLSAMPVKAEAAKYPDRPIRLIVPFAAGGGVDVFARLLAEKVRQLHGYNLIVENRPGANGAIGGAAVRNAEPDGYTLLFSASTHVMARQVMKNAPYDPLTDFAPIARVGEAPMMMIMSPALAPNSLGEMIAAARAAPDKWMFAVSALGAAGHLATIDFNRAAGLDLTIVPYRGTAPGLNDVAAGHIQLMIDPVLALLPMAQENQVKGLGVTTAKRTVLAPKFPTMSEQGLASFDHSTWYGVWAPKALPAPMVNHLNQTINEAVRQLGDEGRLAQIGLEAITQGPTEFEAFARNYVERNAELLQLAKYEPV